MNLSDPDDVVIAQALAEHRIHPSEAHVWRARLVAEPAAGRTILSMLTAVPEVTTQVSSHFSQQAQHEADWKACCEAFGWEDVTQGDSAKFSAPHPGEGIPRSGSAETMEPPPQITEAQAQQYLDQLTMTASEFNAKYPDFLIDPLDRKRP